jgi:hypothetical protein
MIGGLKIQDQREPGINDALDRLEDAYLSLSGWHQVHFLH